MRAKRARDRAAAAAAARMLMSDHERAVEARQAGLPLGPAGGPLEPLAPARPGKPAGSVARWTEQWRAKLLSQYRSPLIVMAEIYSRPVQELVRELRCDPLEAMSLQLKAATELAPYVHSKMPTAVQLEGAPMVGVQIAVSQAKAVELGAIVDGGIRLPKVMEHQELGEGQDG